MILLDPVIEPAPSSVPGKAPQLAFLLHLAQRAGIALEAVGHNLARVACVLSAEGTIEEALRGLFVSLGTEQEVDRLAGAVDGSVQVAPFPVDPDVSLVDVPRPAAGTQVAAHPLLQLRGEALNPAVHGRVIHLHAAIGEHGLEVAVADRELQVPAHGPKDHLGREAEAAERAGGGHGGYSRKGEGRSTAPTWACCSAQRNRTRYRYRQRSGNPYLACRTAGSQFGTPELLFWPWRRLHQFSPPTLPLAATRLCAARKSGRAGDEASSSYRRMAESAKGPPKRCVVYNNTLGRGCLPPPVPRRAHACNRMPGIPGVFRASVRS